MKKQSRARGRASSPKKRMQKSNFMPVIAVGVVLLLVLVVAQDKSGSSTPANTAGGKEKASIHAHQAETRPIALKAVVVKQPVAKINEVVPVKAGPSKSIQDIKLEVRQFTMAREWDEAMAVCENYNGPHAQDVDMLKKEISIKRQRHEELAAADVVKQQAPVAVRALPTRKVAAKPKAPVSIFKDKNPNVIEFAKETAEDRAKKKKGPSVKLQIHSKLVGLPGNVIVVWKTRDKVLSYSRLIKALENSKSKYYQERVEKAKKFLAENPNYYALIPFVEAKMTLRRKGFTVSEVFFNKTTTTTDTYYAATSTTDRYKGYIISYDIQPVGVSVGC
jgi:hypothetical protein